MTTPTPQELLALAEKAEQIYKGFELESLNGVVCSIPDEGLETEPHRTWCRNCQKRYRELKALADALRALAAAPSADEKGYHSCLGGVVRRFNRMYCADCGTAQREDGVALKVGCEGDDGLLRVHPESEVCDVCSPRPTPTGEQK